MAQFMSCAIPVFGSDWDHQGMMIGPPVLPTWGKKTVMVNTKHMEKEVLPEEKDVLLSEGRMPTTIGKWDIDKMQFLASRHSQFSNKCNKNEL